MFKLLIIVAALCYSAYAGAIATPIVGPTLVGSVSYNAPEVTVVKQPITVDQPEYHYRSVPTVVHTQSAIVKSAPVIQAAPILKSHPVPVAAAPVVQTYASPVLAYTAAAHQPLAYGYAYNNLAYAHHIPAYHNGYGYSTVY